MNRRLLPIIAFSILSLAGTNAGPKSARRGGGVTLSVLDLTGSLTYGCQPESWTCDRDDDTLYFNVGVTNFYCLFPDPKCIAGTSLEECNDSDPSGTLGCWGPEHIWCDYDQDSYYVDMGTVLERDTTYCVVSATAPGSGAESAETFSNAVVPATELTVTVTGNGAAAYSAGRLNFTGDVTSFQITDYDGDPEDSPFTCETGDYYFAMAGAGAVTFTLAARDTDQTAKSMTVNVYNADGTIDDTVAATVTVGSAAVYWACNRDNDGNGYVSAGFHTYYIDNPDPLCVEVGGPVLDGDCDDTDPDNLGCCSTVQHWWCDYDGDTYFVDAGTDNTHCESASGVCVSDLTNPGLLGANPGAGLDCNDADAGLTTSCP